MISTVFKLTTINFKVFTSSSLLQIVDVEDNRKHCIFPIQINAPLRFDLNKSGYAFILLSKKEIIDEFDLSSIDYEVDYEEIHKELPHYEVIGHGYVNSNLKKHGKWSYYIPIKGNLIKIKEGGYNNGRKSGDWIEIPNEFNNPCNEVIRYELLSDSSSSDSSSSDSSSSDSSSSESEDITDEYIKGLPDPNEIEPRFDYGTFEELSDEVQCEWHFIMGPKKGEQCIRPAGKDGYCEICIRKRCVRHEIGLAVPDFKFCPYKFQQGKRKGKICKRKIINKAGGGRRNYCSRHYKSAANVIKRYKNNKKNTKKCVHKFKRRKGRGKFCNRFAIKGSKTCRIHTK